MSKPKSKIIYIAFLVLIFACCFFFRFRIGIKDFTASFDTSEVVIINNPQYPFEKRGYYTDYIYLDDETLTFDQLYEESDIVAIVKPQARRQDTDIVKTTSSVEKVIKGNGDYTNEEIVVFEQYYIDDRNEIIIDSGCTTPMKLGNSYMLFLSYVNDYEDGNLFQYTSLLYGKYPLHADLKIEEIAFEGYASPTSYINSTDILEMDIVVFDMNNEIDYIKENMLKDDGGAGAENHERLINAYLKYMKEYKKTYLTFFKQTKSLI